MMALHNDNPAFVGKHAGGDDKKSVTTTNGGRENAKACFLYSDINPAIATGALDGMLAEYV